MSVRFIGPHRHFLSHSTIRYKPRLGRIHAEKRNSGRRAHPAWVVSHAELERYRREGLLPVPGRKP